MPTNFTITMEQLYVLELEDGKYYVGKTKDVKRRVEEHAKGDGPEWTWTYRPVKVLETRPLKDEHDENNTTKNLMKKYGVENVRGGSYCQMELPSSYSEALQAELRGSQDACFKCGGKGHFANMCRRDATVEYVWQCPTCRKEFSTERAAETHAASCSVRRQPERSPQQRKQMGACYRCGRTSHYASECYASRHRKGYELDD